MMSDAIKDFPNQLAFEPVLANAENLGTKGKFIVIGMGGSHLAADLLKIINPSLDVVIHTNYGLPKMSDEALAERLIILSSYSGNTEEVLDAWSTAKEKNFSVAAIAVGGELLDLAKENNAPYVQIPDTGIQPRSALGFSLKALLKVMGDEESLSRIGELASDFDSVKEEDWGRGLAERLEGFVPVIYSSDENFPIAMNWKIKFNETGKVPAFANKLPEMNHNEMTGFDVAPGTSGLSENFYFILLQDGGDNPKISKRIGVLENLLRDRGFNVEVLSLDADSDDVFRKIFSSLILADWTAYYLAEQYGVESEQVPMVEEFKNSIRE
ncbi:MAG: hypothetical protein NTW60_00270 [Candidatus Wolfebacteria bacterium]|nr:hypothetical protein [Candidatus Wolfebacteria bacterium]